MTIGRIRNRRRTACPNRRTAGGVGDHHPVAKQLCHQFGVTSFQTACTGAREFKQRLLKLAAFDCQWIKRILFRFQTKRIAPQNILFQLTGNRFHHQGLFFGRTNFYAVATTSTVIDGNRQSELQIFGANCRFSSKASRCGNHFSVGCQNWANAGMWADKRTLVALNTFFELPLRHIDRNAALFVSGSPQRECPVLLSGKCAYRQFVTFLSVHWYQNVADKWRNRCLYLAAASACKLGLIGSTIAGLPPIFRHHNFYRSLQALCNCRIVHFNDLAAFVPISVDYRITQVFFRLFQRNDLRQFEERDLHQDVKPATEADILSNLHCIDGVELDIIRCNIVFHTAGQFFVEVGSGPVGIEQKGPTWLQAFQQVIFINIGLLGTGNEVGFVNQIRRLDLRIAKTQMRYGNTARFFGIIGKICLSIHIGLVTNDFDSTFIGANCAIGAQSPELTRFGARRGGVDILAQRQRCMVHVINNANGKMIARLLR